jgi:hypothetical protein
MKRLFVVAIILTFSVTYGYSQMHEGGHMMGQGSTGEIQQGQAVAPGYGMMGYGGHMMGQGYGGHMMGGMMGPGGHMMGQGYGGHMMGGMMGPGGHMMEGMMGLDMMGYGTEEEYRKHLDETVDLRRALHNKKFEISEALRNPETTRKTLLQLRKEMLEIKVKIYEKAIKSN